jgi:hypothetical protein
VGVKGLVTLDLCGHRFASEALRTDRIQVDYVRPDGGVLVSNEVVTYRAGGAQKAIAELEQAASHCPRHPTRSAVAGVGLLQERVKRLPRAGLVPASIALEDSVRAVNSGQRRPAEGMLVYQASGNVLSAIYTHHGTLAEQRRIALAAARAAARNLG